MITKKEQLLAAFVFLLWSMGVVLIPTLASYAPPPSLIITCYWLLQLLLLGYVFLHGVVFYYALKGFWQELVGRKRRRGALPLMLYGYTICMVVLSAYLLSQFALEIYR